MTDVCLNREEMSADHKALHTLDDGCASIMRTLLTMQTLAYEMDMPNEINQVGAALRVLHQRVMEKHRPYVLDA